MKEYLPQKPSYFIEDLNDFDVNERSIHLSTSAMNVDRLSVCSIDNMWVVGVTEISLKKILPLVNPRYLNVYHILAKDLEALELMTTTETLILEWSTKSDSFWDLSKNISLRTLKIRDFGRLKNIQKIRSAEQVESLTLAGGINKKLELETLKPLESLTNLKYLELGNIKVQDGSLKPLGNLKNLEELGISNQIDINEYAWLASRLPNTKCELFGGSMKVAVKNLGNTVIYDTMITGKRRPFLLSSKDGDRINDYINKFEKLKIELADKS